MLRSRRIIPPSRIVPNLEELPVAFAISGWTRSNLAQSPVRSRLWAVLLSGWVAAGFLAGAAADTITLGNGVQVEGVYGKVASLVGGAGGPGGVVVQPIGLMDDEGRRVFVRNGNIVAHSTAAGVNNLERIKLDQMVASAGMAISSVGSIVKVDPFDEHGRRIFVMSSAKGNLPIIQGITEITPRFTKVESLARGDYQFVWTMRIATSSIPRETLSKILLQKIDRKDPNERLRIVRLYLQSERIQDARAELEQLISEFPDLAELQGQVTAMRQLGAQRLLKEVELRREAGQPQLAYAMLNSFPADGVAGATQLKVRGDLEEFAATRARGENLLKLLKEHYEALKDDAARKELTSICSEIERELNIHSFDRMADYLRLSSDPDLSPDQKVSLAVSGWLLGSGSGIDNLAVTRSLTKVRELARAYLLAPDAPSRKQILGELQSLEGATPEYLSKILASMKPPLDPTPPPPALPPVAQPAGNAAAAKDPNACAPDDADLLKKAPAPPKADPPPVANNPPAEPPPTLDNGAQPPAKAQIEGFYTYETAGLPEQPVLRYHVQLPPEYDPLRRYPCLVTLHSAGATARSQIDWWAGPYDPKARMRYGQAARRGYIVIAPEWTKEHQRVYEFSAREHANTLFALRDALKRFSIDVDKVFLSGHSMGGDAAWDIGLSHPDLWAGVLPFVAQADKYISRYKENGRLLPMYFVAGEKDGARWINNASDWDRYLSYVGYDAMVVQYQGRGHEHFHDEIQNCFEWMHFHRRNFFPREFHTLTMRPTDNFFWYVELERIPARSVYLPVEPWPPTRTVSAAKVDANLFNAAGKSGVTVSTTADKVTVWLSPEMVDFSQEVSVTLRGKKISVPPPSLAVILEDVRTRGDRQHPFWSKVQN